MNELKEKARKILEVLEKEYPDARLTLEFTSPFDLLIATVLAARTKDVVVNRVMKEIRKKYPDAKTLASATPQEILPLLKGINMAGNKARYICQIARIVHEKYGGKVPETMEELTSLPGVGRKTANVVMGNAMGIVAGIEVDTHIGRVSYRLGLTSKTSPEEIERDLMAILPREKWLKYTHVAKEHGRKVCTARNPRCNKCMLAFLCDKQGV